MFDFEPTIIGCSPEGTGWFYEYDNSYHGTIFVRLLLMETVPTYYSNYNGFGQAYSASTIPIGKKSSDGKTFYWYTYNSNINNTSAANQLNESSIIYHYFAIG